MVKNTTGGSKHKGLARKLVNAPINNKLRLPEDECECYAKTVKMLGNGMCHVNLVYKDKLYENVVCHIRGKFKNKNKRSNMVSIGDILLVGIRSWESNVNNCDLLSIYSINQHNLISIPNIINNIQNTSNDNNDDILFSNSINSNSFNDSKSISLHNEELSQTIIDIDFDNI